MKFLLDVCVDSRALRTSLTELGHDVLSASVEHRQASDKDLLALAYQQERILVTEDKDFGKLVFANRQPHRSIVRLAQFSTIEQVEAMRNLIEQHSDAMLAGAIIVVTGKLARIKFPSSLE